MAERCAATNKDGRPCSARPLPGGNRCPWHSPELAKRRHEWSVRGGQNRSRKARAQKAADGLDLAEVAGLLGITLKLVIAGKVEPAQASAAASVARALVAVREVSAVEERLRELEAIAGLGDDAKRSAG